MNTTLHFGTFDWIIVAIILLSVIVSFFRGFLREAISLATWFFAFYCAIRFSPIVDRWLVTSITHAMTRYITSIVIVFVVVLIIGMLINKLAHHMISSVGLGPFDKGLGVIFGAARGLLFIVIILLVITESSYQNADWYKQSRLAPYFQAPVSYFVKMLPTDLRSVSSWINHLNSFREKYHHTMTN